MDDLEPVSQRIKELFPYTAQRAAAGDAHDQIVLELLIAAYDAALQDIAMARTVKIIKSRYASQPLAADGRDC